MANAFNTYFAAKRSAMMEGQQMLEMEQFAQTQRRDRELRNILSDAYTPSTPEIPRYGPTPSGEALTPIPGTPGGMNIRNALNAMYAGGFGPEALGYETKMKSAGGLPSAVKEYEYWNRLSPEDRKKFLGVKRAQQFLDIGSGYVAPSMVDPTQTRPVATRELKPAERLGYITEKAAAVKAEEIKAKKMGIEPKVRLTAQIAEKRAALVSNAIDKAIGQVNALTAGPGALTAGVPGTPAKDLSATLDTIRANIGFDRLQEMKASSPTGGALGQVSDRETKLLQAVLGSLDQTQSPRQLKENLKISKIAIIGSWKRIADAYEQDYGTTMPTAGTPLEGGKEGSGQTPQQTPRSGAQNQLEGKLEKPSSAIDSLVNKYAD